MNIKDAADRLKSLIERSKQGEALLGMQWQKECESLVASFEEMLGREEDLRNSLAECVLEMKKNPHAGRFDTVRKGAEELLKDVSIATEPSLPIINLQEPSLNYTGIDLNFDAKDPVCKNCDKKKSRHKALTHNCGLGKGLGVSFYPDMFFEEKAKKEKKK